MKRQLVLFGLFFIIPLSLCQDLLIRPNNVYQNIMLEVHDYYNSTCIFMLHSTAHAMTKQGMENNTRMLDLQNFFSQKHIRTVTMEIDHFVTQIGGRYYHIKRPLFVLLNDNEETRKQFATVVPWMDMAYPNWLLFAKTTEKFENFFKNIYIPFDCIFMVSTPTSDIHETIYEVYQVSKSTQLRNNEFATWNIQDGMKESKYSLWQRRSNMFGYQLRVVSIEDPPASTIIRDENNEIIGLGGFFGSFIELLKESMNCTFIYQSTEEFGYLLDNGTWTGAINSLIHNDSDIFAAELMMTSDRLAAVRFTTPIYSTKCRAFIKRPDSSALKWDAYVVPFAPNIWAAMGITILVSSITISIVKNFASVTFATGEEYHHEPERFSEIFHAVYGAFCSQGMEGSLIDPIRVIHIVVHMTGVVILAAYSAALISALAVKTFIMPFTTMEGLLRDGTYRFGVVGNSADFSFFQNTSDKVLSILFDEVLVKETDLPRNYLEGLTRVCTEDKYAFMTLDNMVSQLQRYVDCILVPLDTISTTSIAMALQPNSPYRGIINSNILLLRDSGVLNRLLHSEWSNSNENSDSAWTQVGIANILPLITVLAGGAILGFFMLSGEKLIFLKLAQYRLRKMISKRLITTVKYPSGTKRAF